MNIRTALALPYRLGRVPVTTLDQLLRARLGEDSPLSRTVHQALDTSDRVIGRLLGDSDLAPNPIVVTQPGEATAKSAQPAPRDDDKPAAVIHAERAAEFLAQAETAEATLPTSTQHAASRGNRSVSSIERSLRQSTAAAEARAHQATDQE